MGIYTMRSTDFTHCTLVIEMTEKEKLRKGEIVKE